MSRNNDVGGETFLGILGTIALLIACCLFLSWAYKNRMNECMAARNDEFVCRVYAESVFR